MNHYIANLGAISLFLFSVLVAIIAAVHTYSFVMYSDYLLASITFFYFLCGTFLAAALIQLKRGTA